MGGRGWIREAAFLLCYLPILAGAGFLARAGALELQRPLTQLALFLMSAGWAGAVVLSRGVRDSTAVLGTVLAGALALRLCALASQLDLSDDVQRYVWEGGLVAGGIDPYRHAPDSPELEVWRSRWPETWEQVDHRSVPSAYPPLAQLVHAALVRLAGGPEDHGRAVLWLRAFSAGCELLITWPLLVLLRARSLPLARVAVWAWSPLAALEFAGSGHGDALAILLAVAGLSVLVRSESRGARAAHPAREHLGIALLTGGAMAKLLPAAWLPFALRGVARPARGLLIALAVALALALGCLVLTGGWPGLGGLGEYAFRWESFSLVFRWVERPLHEHFALDESWTDPRRIARALVLLAWFTLGVFAWTARLDPVRCAALLTGGFLVLTPTLHPWYLAWGLAFLVLFPSRAWTVLLASSPLLYWPLERWREEHVWDEPCWLWPALAVPFFSLLALELVRRRSPA